MRPPGQSQWPCVFCKDIHYPSQCPISTANKLEVIAKEKLCRGCLRPHPGACRNPRRGCRHCNVYDHHTAICPSPPSTPTPTPAATTGISAAATTSVEVLLKTATVFISGPNGVRKAICFFDDGSQKSFIRRELAEELNLEIIGQETLMISHFGSNVLTEAETMKLRKVRVKGSFPHAQIVELDVLDKQEICSAQPYIHTEFARQLNAEGKYLADDRFIQEQEFPEIDLLIGANLMWEVVGRASRTSNCGLRAVDSKFGWLIIG